MNPNSKIRDLLNEYKIRYLEFLFIRRLALKTGAELPEELKEKILKNMDWDNEKDRWKYASENFKEMRGNSYKDF